MDNITDFMKKVLPEFKKEFRNGITDLSFYPLEPVMPVNSDNDRLINYPKDNRSFSQNYLKQVKMTKTIPRDYGSIQFKGKPQVLTDLYGYEAVFDDANMYYFQK